MVNQSDIRNAIEYFTTRVKEWNSNTFGNIFERKNSIIARLQGIQKFPKYTISNFLINLESKLIEEFNSILKLEKEF